MQDVMQQDTIGSQLMSQLSGTTMLSQMMGEVAVLKPACICSPAVCEKKTSKGKL